MWKFGIASIASLCVLTGGVAVPMLMADAPTTGPATAPAGTDKIDGTVVDQNKQLVTGATVEIFLAKPSKKDAKAADPTIAVHSTASELAQGGKRQKQEPVQPEITTGNDGAFSFTGLADGKYVVVARLKGTGMARKEVKLDSANSSDTITLTLAARKQKNAAQ